MLRFQFQLQPCLQAEQTIRIQKYFVYVKMQVVPWSSKGLIYQIETAVSSRSIYTWHSELMNHEEQP